MGLEGLVGFDSDPQPKKDGGSLIKMIFVPGSYVAKALSLNKGTLNDLGSAIFDTTQFQDKAATVLILNSCKTVASAVYGALFGESVRLAGYATLAYTALNGISDFVR